MDFGKLFGDAWDLLIKELGNLIVFTLVAIALSFTIVLIPATASGFVRGMLGYVRDGRAPELSELWDFQDYGATLLLLVLGGILVSIGFMLLIVPGVILCVWWLYALHFVVDRKLFFWDAMEASRETIGSTGFVNGLALVVILAILNSIGGSFAGLGTLLTMPYGMLLLTRAYLDVTAEPTQVERRAGAAPTPPVTT